MPLTLLVVGAATIGWMVARWFQQRSVVANEASNRLLFNANPQPMLVCALDTQRLLDANDAAIAHYRYSRADFLAMKLADIGMPGDVSEVEALLARLATRGDGDVHESGIWRHLTKDGQTLDVEVTVNRMRFHDRPACLVLARDVTERRAAEVLMRAHQDELSALTRQMLLQERAGRLQLAQTLHDQIGQGLTMVSMQLDTVSGQCRQAGLQGSAAIVSRSSALISTAMETVRGLQHELHPPMLLQHGLLAALGDEVAKMQGASQSIDLRLEGDPGPAQRWPAHVEYAAFMIAREGATNALRHAGASLVTMSLRAEVGQLQLRIEDDGIGLPHALQKGRNGHLGIIGMRERALAIGAHFELGSRPQGGTLVLMLWSAA
jgi:PAS domain S-box-containing protein